MLHLEQIQYLWLLLGIPVFIGLFVAVRLQIRKQREAFGDLLGLERLAPKISTQKRPLKFALIVSAFAFLVIALANPRAGNKTQSIKRQGIDVYIAMDVSRSMWAEDLKPNRMERARQFAQKLISSLRGDRIGLILFAGQSFLQMPLTVDYAAAEMFVRTASPELDITQGTAIESAIDLVTDISAKEEKEKQRALVVITDGENHDPAAVTAAQNALGIGIRTFLVGAGTEAGAPIPVQERGRRQYKLDKQGQVVQSKMNSSLLQEIATAGGGIILDINDVDRSIARLRAQLSTIEKSEFEQQDFDVFETYYQYFVIVAILLLIAEFMIGYQRNQWFK